MSFEPESMSWKHAADLERGDVPLIPEAAAAQRAGAVLRRFVASPYLTDEFWSEVGGKAMASFGVLSQIHADLTADPKRIGERGEVLRQQPTASQDQYDWNLERAAEAKQAWVDHCAAAETIRHQRLAEHDPDARGADEDSDRIAQERRDAEAAAGMPKGMTA